MAVSYRVEYVPCMFPNDLYAGFMADFWTLEGPCVSEFLVASENIKSLLHSDTYFILVLASDLNAGFMAGFWTLEGPKVPAAFVAT